MNQALPGRMLAILACLVLGVWSQVAIQTSEFIHDDHIFVVNNGASGFDAWSRDSYAAAGYVGAPPVVYRPLGVEYMAVARKVLGWHSPTPWHIVSIGLHSLVAVLLATLLLKLGTGTWTAFWCTLAWACSPIQTEVVGWVSAQFELLSAALVLLALLMQVTIRWPGGLLALPLYSMAILVKETSIAALPALFLAAAWSAQQHRKERDGGGIYPVVSAMTTAAVCLLMIYSLLDLRAAVGVGQRLPSGASGLAMAASVGDGLLRALGLSDFLAVSGPPLHLPSAPSLLALGILLGISAGAVRVAGLKALLWVSFLLLPLPGLLFGQSLYAERTDPDRFFYLGFMAVPVLISLVVLPPTGLKLPGIIRRRRNLVMTALCGFLALRAHSEIPHWRTFEGVLSRQIALGKDSTHIRFLRGLERMKAGNTAGAVEDFEYCSTYEWRQGRRKQCQVALYDLTGTWSNLKGR